MADSLWSSKIELEKAHDYTESRVVVARWDGTFVSRTASDALWDVARWLARDMFEDDSKKRIGDFNSTALELLANLLKQKS